MDEALQREMLALLPRLRRFACALTGSVDRGEDLLQTTCERAIAQIHQFQPGTRLDSWMYRIARNSFLNDQRARGVRTAHLNEVSQSESSVFDGNRAMESHLTYEAVAQFVARLPEEQRSVLLLVCVEGLSYREVAEITDLPVGTITSRLGRARQALKEWMERENGD